VPVACDMSTAADTPAERLAEYGRLFRRALLRRERRGDRIVFAFRPEAATRAAVQDLARREAACCPFLDYRVETVGDELVWTITNPVAGDRRASADAVLDAFYASPKTPTRRSDFAAVLSHRRRGDEGACRQESSGATHPAARDRRTRPPAARTRRAAPRSRRCGPPPGSTRAASATARRRSSRGSPPPRRGRGRHR